MLKRNIAVLTIAVVVLGTGAYAWAQGAPERPTTTTLEPGSAQPKSRPGGSWGFTGPKAMVTFSSEGDLQSTVAFTLTSSSPLALL